MDAFTLGKYMHQAFFDTAFYMRTSLNESFFHLMALWVFKWAGWSNAGYLLGAQCCYLTHNEQCESKQLTTGRIEKTTRNPEGPAYDQKYLTSPLINCICCCGKRM